MNLQSISQNFLSNGIYVEDGEVGLKVSPGSGLSVNIAPGYAYLEGYYNEMIQNLQRR